MAEIRVDPGNTTQVFSLGCRWTIQYTGQHAVMTALLAMGPAAKEGCAIAANEAAKKVRVMVGDRIARELPIPRREIDQVIGISRRATELDPTAVVTVRDQPIPLIRFGAYQTRVGVEAVTRRSRGVDVRPHAFIARSRRGSQAVFIRRTKKRLPIDELYGPSVRDIAVSETTQITDRSERILFRELMNARDYIVNVEGGYKTLGPSYAE